MTQTVAIPQLEYAPKTVQPEEKIPKLLPKIIPNGDDWQSRKVLERIVEWFYDRIENHNIDVGGKYFDEENYNYVLKLLWSDLDPEVAGKEFSDRAWKHSNHYKSLDCREIKKSVTGIYNTLAEIFRYKERLDKNSCKYCYSCPLPNIFLG